MSQNSRNNVADTQPGHPGASPPATSNRFSTMWGNITTRRKLASVRSVFPHNNDTTVKNIAETYDDVLQFLRSVSAAILESPLISQKKNTQTKSLFRLSKTICFENCHSTDMQSPNKSSDASFEKSALRRDPIFSDRSHD